MRERSHKISRSFDRPLRTGVWHCDYAICVVSTARNSHRSPFHRLPKAPRCAVLSNACNSQPLHPKATEQSLFSFFFIEQSLYYFVDRFLHRCGIEVGFQIIVDEWFVSFSTNEETLLKTDAYRKIATTNFAGRRRLADSLRRLLRSRRNWLST